MKTAILFTVFGVMMYFIITGSSSGTSYDEFGNRVVITLCDERDACLAEIGNACEERGYHLTREEKRGEKNYIVAECGQ